MDIVIFPYFSAFFVVVVCFLVGYLLNWTIFHITHAQCSKEKVPRRSNLLVSLLLLFTRAFTLAFFPISFHLRLLFLLFFLHHFASLSENNANKRETLHCWMNQGKPKIGVWEAKRKKLLVSSSYPSVADTKIEENHSMCTHTHTNIY